MNLHFFGSQVTSFKLNQQYFFNSVIIYLPSSCCKPLWVSSVEHKGRYFEEWSELWHHWLP